MEHYQPLSKMLNQILFQTGESIPMQARISLGVAKDHYEHDPSPENKRKLNMQIGNMLEFLNKDWQAALAQVHKPWHASEEVMASLRKLWTIGRELFSQEKYAQAAALQDILRQLLQDVPGEQEIQIVFVSDDDKMESGLPQAFQAQEQRGRIDDKLENFSERLQIAKLIPKLVALADKLDDMGMHTQAQSLDETLKGLHPRETDPVGWKEWQHMGKERPESGEQRWRRKREEEGLVEESPREVFHLWLLSEFPKRVAEMNMDLFDLLNNNKVAPIGLFLQDNPNADKAPGALDEIKEAWDQYGTDIDTLHILQSRINKLRHSGSSGSRMKRLIEKLSNTGYGKQAQALLRLAKDVQEKWCQECGTHYLYDVDSRDRGCPNCARLRAKDLWEAGKRVPVRPTLERWKEKLKPRKEAAQDNHGGKPDKVVEIADAIRRDQPDISDEAAYRMAWETYCSYVNPGHKGCTEKGKSKRKSPKPY